MKHLTENELVDLIEGSLGAERAAHADACDACHRQAEELGAIMREARSVEVPEPSPLFWEHFSLRVHDAVTAEPDATSAGWMSSIAARARLVLATAAIALVVAVAVWQAPGPTVDEDAQIAGTPGDLGDLLEAELVADDTAEWTFVVNVAQGLKWEEIQETGLMVRPGAAERAVLQLSQTERRELVRLLEAELERAKT